jgi:hypothetical protein
MTKLMHTHSRWIKNPNVKIETLKFLEEKQGHLHDFNKCFKQNVQSKILIN